MLSIPPILLIFFSFLDQTIPTWPREPEVNPSTFPPQISSICLRKIEKCVFVFISSHLPPQPGRERLSKNHCLVILPPPLPAGPVLFSFFTSRVSTNGSDPPMESQFYLFEDIDQTDPNDSNPTEDEGKFGGVLVKKGVFLDCTVFTRRLLWSTTAMKWVLLIVFLPFTYWPWNSKSTQIASRTANITFLLLSISNISMKRYKRLKVIASSTPSLQQHEK